MCLCLISDVASCSYTVPDVISTTSQASGSTSSTSPSPSTSDGASNSDGKKGGVSGGAVGGAVAAVVIALLLAIIAFLVWQRRRKRARGNNVTDLNEGFYDSRAAANALQPYNVTPWTPGTQNTSTANLTVAPAFMGKTQSRTDSADASAQLLPYIPGSPDTEPWNIVGAEVGSAAGDSSGSRTSRSAKLAAEALRAHNNAQGATAEPIAMTPLSPPSATSPNDADLVQRISAQVAAMLRESDGGPLPPAYAEAAAAGRRRRRKSDANA